MKQGGFIGLRFKRAKTLAKVTARLPDGEHGGAAWLYERIDPKRKVEPIDAKEGIKALFKNGPLLLNTYQTFLEAKRLTRLMGAVKRAEAALGFESKRIGFNSGPWVCKISGQEWPSVEEAVRITATQDKVALEDIIGAPSGEKDQEQQIDLPLASKMSGINKGTIWRAAKKGDIANNGQKGRALRLDLHSFNDWLLERAKGPEREESETTVESKVRKHVPECKD
jgi:hypothetical protein